MIPSQRVRRPDPTGITGKAVGTHELRDRSNPTVNVGTPTSGVRGHADLGTALGELAARRGDQMVIANGDRYHVATVAAGRINTNIPNDGFLTKQHAERVVAIEQQGRVWAPKGDWFVAPQQTKP